MVKVDGSGRLTRRNRRFLRSYKPAAYSYKPVIVVEEDGEHVSAPDWGARGTVGGDTPEDISSRPVVVREERSPSVPVRGDRSDNVYTPEPTIDLPMRNVLPELDISGPVIRDQPEIRRSARSTKGQSSRFADYVTGQEYENAEG